ncbi:ProQ/FINO family protein [Vogesella sp. XCS3]|uniref:ProQ/FINO family protein n=1 Tax=Vogesella sp. XCS3 TaxID=2877939 RepID=UPI001D0A6E25|nr:ProQ/FINO family protein [Vogesella sp. XCS3]UDM18939.1 ProQ/FinO family protein [Vogesella sp. XCS3]
MTTKNRTKTTRLVSSLKKRLEGLYPHIFATRNPRDVRPLAINIHDQLIHELGLLTGRQRYALRIVLNDYCNTLAYQWALAKGRHRIDTNGQPVAPVEPHIKKQAFAAIQKSIKGQPKVA